MLTSKLKPKLNGSGAGVRGNQANSNHRRTTIPGTVQTSLVPQQSRGFPNLIMTLLPSSRAGISGFGFLCGLALVVVGCAPNRLAETTPAQLRLATFSADVTVPLGHGMMGGSWLSKSVADPLEANGFVLLGGEAPVVFVSVDWCEIRNDAYERWQTVLAEAAGTTPDHVLVTTVHQHDAPVADLEAERLLRSRKLAGTICDPGLPRARRAIRREGAARIVAVRAAVHAHRHRPGEGREGRLEPPLHDARWRGAFRPHQQHAQAGRHRRR